MILKAPSTTPLPTNPRLRAGVRAERQMAHYLHRAFATSADLYIINDLRLVDPEQPEPDPRTGGSKPGVAQIDHLVLHRYGAFIVESKSVTGTVTVRDDGNGRDEWTGSGKGMASPLRQAERQGELLREFLHRHRERLLGKMGTGFRTLSKLVHGTDQRGFSTLPIQHVIALSDACVIKRVNKWAPPDDGFAAFVIKADNVPKTIEGEFTRHAKGPADRYGIWSMKPEELGAVADFLVASHTPRASPRQRTPEPATPATAEPAPARSEAQPAAPTPPCPKCGTPTVLRYAKKGKNAGQPFFGCPGYPRCRGIVPIAGGNEAS